MSAPAASILVVDDDTDLSSLAALILRRAGHQVDTAGSGRDALAAVMRRTYDLILLDINMPGMDGWEVLKLLKADVSTMGIAVVMFSVRGEIRDKVHGLQDGAMDYITKPFSVDGLTQRVDTILRQRQTGVVGQ